VADRRRPRGRAPTAHLTDNPVEVRAGKLIGGGRSLGHTGGTTWMLRGALPAELVLAAPTRRRAGIVEADVLEVVHDPHPARLESPCPHADACGGCDWPHVDSAAGASLKRSVAAESATRFPLLEARLRAASITTSPPAYRLRNRLHWDPRETTLGFYGHRSWRVADSEHRVGAGPAQGAGAAGGDGLREGLPVHRRDRIRGERLGDLQRHHLGALLRGDGPRSPVGLGLRLVLRTLGTHPVPQPPHRQRHDRTIYQFCIDS